MLAPPCWTRNWIVSFVAIQIIIPAARAESPWSVIALTGHTAPGTSLSFVRFGPPTLNTRGDIAFLGRVPQIDETGAPVPCPRGGAGCILTTSGAWRAAADNSLKPLVVPGDELSVAPGPVRSIESVMMNGAGTAAVLAQFSTGRGIYRSSDDGLNSVAVIGQPVGTDHLVFGGDIRSPVIDDSGNMMFYADTLNPVTNVRSASHWATNGAQIERGPPLVDFRFGFSTDGHLAFSRGIIGQAFGYGVYLGDLQSQQVVLQSSTPATGTSSIFGYPQPPSVNNNGQFVTHVTLGPTTGPVAGTGIWTGDHQDVVPVVVSGEEAPETNVAFESFNYFPKINNAGMIAFSALLAGDEISQSKQQGLWKAIAGKLKNVVQQGDPAPGTDGYFGRLALPQSDGFYYWHGESAPFALNNRGQMAFIAQLTGPDVMFENDSGLWAESNSGEILLLLREGDLITVGPGDVRQVAGFQFRFGGGYGGGFTDLGQLALQVSFADGSHAILINNLVAVPEPEFVGCMWSILVLWPRRAVRVFPFAHHARALGERARARR